MTEQEIIKNLQDKTYVRAFGLMSPEQQEVYRKVGIKNCIMYYGGISWPEYNDMRFLKDCYGKWVDYLVYAIKPDYKPEPEFEDLEIGKFYDAAGDLILGVEIADKFFSISQLPSLPNFVEFNENKQRNLLIEDVANKHREGKTVYARLRK